MFRSEYGDYPPFLGRALILALIVSLLIAALCLGAMLPGRMIGPSLDRYEGGKKVFAIAALSEMESTALRETTDAYIAVAYRVVDVERCRLRVLSGWKSGYIPSSASRTVRKRRLVPTRCPDRVPQTG